MKRNGVCRGTHISIIQAFYYQFGFYFYCTDVNKTFLYDLFSSSLRYNCITCTLAWNIVQVSPRPATISNFSLISYASLLALLSVLEAFVYIVHVHCSRQCWWYVRIMRRVFYFHNYIPGNLRLSTVRFCKRCTLSLAQWNPVTFGNRLKDLNCPGGH